ncbi:MAG: phospho-sugar mutase [Clostridia bacterium]|nr:phospho-sugar mutase [Clostridia bacterium]
MADYKQEYELWLNDPYFNQATREQLAAISGQEEEIFDRFYQNLSFGTAGLRGVLGAGTNRMNEYTVAQAAEGFARYLDTLGPEAAARGVAICYDSRHRSREFAEISAAILAAHGIRSYFMDELRPVPVLSFTVRHLNCIGGIMVTASHNPAKYNGYKVYGEDGGQMPPEAADVVAAEMAKITDYRSLQWSDLDEASATGLINVIGPEFDKAYSDMLKKLSISPDSVARHKDMKIVYTPLHGAGNKPVRRILKEIGFENVLVVTEQEQPDGAFPTVAFPNPEERSALQMAIDLATQEEASLVIATDPDSDRTGLAVRKPDGEYAVMTGNQIGILLLDYILSSRSARGELPEKSFVVTTIVSSRMVKKICDHYGVELFITLTGFKFIAEQIKLHDEDGDMHFQFGFEESFGYLAGRDVRDKDAVVASMLLAELAAVAADEGMTLYDRMQKIYETYGYAAEKTISVMAEGAEGQRNIAKAMTTLRAEKNAVIAGIPVKYINDYETRERLDTASGEVTPIDTTNSNVLLYELDGYDWMCVRPSGTEPKIKVYFGCYAESQTEAETELNSIRESFLGYVKSLL